MFLNVEGERFLLLPLGIGSECYMALRNNRKAVGIELKDSYYQTAIKNCNNAIAKKKQLSIVFD